MPLTLAPPSAPPGLQQRLRRLLGHYRRVIVLRDGSLIGLLALLAFGLLAWIDARSHLPVFVRSLILVGVLSGLIALFLRWIVIPWRRESDLVAMALRVERKYPEFNDSLASAVQFLKAGRDEAIGSAELREETIRRAEDTLADVDIGLAVDARGLKRSLVALAAVIGVGVWLFVFKAPADSRMALQRTLFPTTGAEWPAETTLEIVEPQPLPYRLPQGEALDVRVNVRGVIPDRVQVGLWLDGAAATDQAYTIPKNPQTPAVATFAVRFEPGRISKSFRFRVRANDADTGWQSVNVVARPAFAPRDGRPSPQVHLTYPAYTDLQPTDLPDGGTVIEAVTATLVRIRAATDRPVARAMLLYRPEPPRLPLAAFLAAHAPGTALQRVTSFTLGSEAWHEIPVQLTGGGRLIDVDFVPRLPGPYVLRIEDETGLSASRTLDIRIVPDPSPVVDLQRPSAATESLSLVPDADFTLAALAQDRMFAVRQVFLEYQTRSDEPFRRVLKFDSPTVSAIVPPLMSCIRMPLTLPPAPFPRLQAYVVAERLNVRQFAHPDGAPLKVGDTLTLRVGATDFDDVTFNKPPGYSHPVELQIVSKSHLDAALQQGLAQMRTDMLLLRDLQQDARRKVQEALKKLQQSGRLQRDDLEQLVQAEQIQQQIRARINGADGGLLAQTARMKQTILDNRLPRSATTQRVEAAAADLNRLAEEELEPIEPLLGSARREHDRPNGAPEPPLTRAERHQREVEETLKSLLERLEPWSGAGEVRGEARSILSELRKQADLLNQLRQGQKPGISGSQRDDLPQDVRDDLDRSAVRPDRLAERVRQLLEKMERVADEKESALKEKLEQLQAKEEEAKEKEKEARKQPKGSPAEQRLRRQAESARDDAEVLRSAADALKEEADALRNALKQAGAQGLRKDMQNVPAQIRNNQLGDAASHQQSAADRLEKLVKALEEQSKTEDADLLQKKMKDADARLEKLLDGQELLQKKVDAAKLIADPKEREDELMKLARDQERLEKEARELAQQLTRAGADAAAQELRRAARQMEEARGELDQGQPPDANQEEALRHLDETQDQLTRNRDRSEEELLRDKLTKAADLLRALRDRQATALDEEKRLHAKVLADKGWKLTAAKEALPALIDQQAGLARELRSLIEKRFDSELVFARMLRQSAEAMDDAVKRLEQRKEDVLDQLEGIGVFSPELENRADQIIRARQELALKRLDQLLEALKPDKDMLRPPPKKKAADPMMDPPKAKPSDALPPLAQLKALRALQADVADRTAAFDKAHPVRAKLTEDEIAELDSLRRAQSDVAELVRELTPAPTMGDQP